MRNKNVWRRKWRENKTSRTEHQFINKLWLNAIELRYIRSIEICRIFILYTGIKVQSLTRNIIKSARFLEVKAEPRAELRKCWI